MDPVSQGALGASVPQAISTPQKLKAATIVGCLAGMAPDLDVFIQSPTDPLLFLEYHRQFTHALVFIPVGALLCSLVFVRFARSLSFREVYLASLLGYATHGVLDACTTYGTLLLWPFSDVRIAWNNVSVVDPLATLPLLALVIVGYRRGNSWFARAGLAWFVCYLLFGVVQRERAETVGWQIAHTAGIEPVRLEAKPGFANLFLWKLVIETETEFSVHAVRLFATPKVFPGDSIPKLDVARDLPWLDPASQQAKDIERFRWFSNDYLASSPERPDYIIDVRYSVVPNEISPLWGIQLDPGAAPDTHVKYVTNRADSAGRVRDLRRMLLEP